MCLVFLSPKSETSDGIFLIKNGNKGSKLSVKYTVERLYEKKKNTLQTVLLYINLIYLGYL